jgi:hypothetical protein
MLRTTVERCCVLLHDNPCPYTAAPTAETFRKLEFDITAHPPYSPNLASSDYHLFGPLKRGIKGMSIHLGPRSEVSSACMAHYSAENIIF